MKELIRLRKAYNRCKDPLIAAMIWADIEYLEIKLGIELEPYQERKTG